MRPLLLAVVALVGATVMAACGKDEPRKVSLESPGPASSAPAGATRTSPANGRPLRVAVAAMISPKETFSAYGDLVGYLGREVGMEVDFVQRKSYQEVNALLKKELLDVAFVCSGAYVEGHDDFGMEILAAPVSRGRTVYFSYIIVPGDSPVRTFADLRGKSFAFTDPLSNTGRLVPAYRLARMKETPERFFGSVVYTYSHDRSIESVARKLVDGAAVDSLVFDYLERKKPELVSRTRIVDRSDPFGIPPFVVSRAVGPGLKAKLRDVLLHAHETEEGRRILSTIMIEKFVAVDDNIYDSVRDMRRWIARNEGK